MRARGMKGVIRLPNGTPPWGAVHAGAGNERPEGVAPPVGVWRAQSMRARGMKETTLPTVGRARPGAVHAGAGNESVIGTKVPIRLGAQSMRARGRKGITSRGWFVRFQVHLVRVCGLSCRTQCDQNDHKAQGFTS